MNPPSAAQLSVVIPTLNAAARLPACLEALVPAAVQGLIREVIVVDGGSTDDTIAIADGFGARLIKASAGRGGQLKAGSAVARGEWRLFLHGDTVLAPDWGDEALRFMTAQNMERAGVFTLSFDRQGAGPGLVAAGTMARTYLIKSPYGDQGLIISRRLYEEVGGYNDMPLFEDVDIIQRVIRHGGRRALHVFNAKAVTSAERYERDGYVPRVMKNAWLFARYHMGVSPEKLAEAYR